MVLRKLEERLGLPPLADISQAKEVLTLANELLKLVNGLDMRKTDAVKEILEVASRLPASTEHLRLVVELVKEIKDLPTERIREVDRLIKRVGEIIEKAPAEVVNLLSSLKEEG